MGKMVEIRTLNNVSMEKVYEAFHTAFADYVEPFDLSYEQLKYMVERRGCRLDMSFGAFHGDDLVGFTLNGIGHWNGQLTAYDTGTGIVKEFRKQGIATRMFNESLPVLKGNKINQYLLEVIKTNTSAFDLYKKAGFRITREFDYYVAPESELVVNIATAHGLFVTKELDIPNWEQFKRLWDFEPSWQNSIDSINRKLEYFIFLGLFDNANLIGYGIIEEHSGDIPQIAVAKEYRNRGLGKVLLKKLLEKSDSTQIKIINSDAGSQPFKKFCESINLTPGPGQYEMLLQL